MQKETLPDKREIKDHVGNETFYRGADYVRKGFVGQIKVEFSSAIGKVRNSEGIIYTSEAYFDLDGTIMDSDCSCPVGVGCKHVAAMLISLANKEEKAGKSLTLEVKNKPKEKQKYGWESALSQSFEEEFGQKSSGETPLYGVDLLFRIAQNKNIMEFEVKIRTIDPISKKYSQNNLNWDNFDNQYITREFKINDRAANQLAAWRKILRTTQDNYYGYNNNWLKISGSFADTFLNLIKQDPLKGVTHSFQIGKKSVPIQTFEYKVLPKVNVTDTDGGILLQTVFTHEKDGEETVLDPEKEMMFFGDPLSFMIMGRLLVNNPDLTLEHPIFFAEFAKGVGIRSITPFQQGLVIKDKEIKAFQEIYLRKVVKKIAFINNSSKIVVPSVEDVWLICRLGKVGEKNIKIDLFYEYGNTRIDIGNKDQKDGLLRDFIEEENLKELFMSKFSSIDPNRLEYSLEEAYLLVEELKQNLRSGEKIKIEREEGLPEFKIFHQKPDIKFDLDNKKKDKNGDDVIGDWFDLRMKINIGEHEVFLEQIIVALKKGERYIFLENGTMIDFHHNDFSDLKKLLKEAEHMMEPESKSISVGVFQAGWFDELMKLGIINKEVKGWKNKMNALLDFKRIESLEKVEGLQASLRDYQKDGVSWLSYLKQNNLGGVLADDMGLGKTIQSIALILENLPNKKTPVLVIAPTSVVENWATEIEKFAPSLNTVVLRSGNRDEDYKMMKKAHVVVVSYALLVRDEEILLPVIWDMIIIDEAQCMKNYQSKAYSLIRKLKTGSKIALTGTPMENNLTELWSIFSVVCPGLFSDVKHFTENFRNPVEKEKNFDALQRMKNRIRPFIMRRKKEMVEKDLPEKTENVVLLEMEDSQRKIYDLYIHKQRQKVLNLLASGGMQKNRFEILTAITRMRQLCLHPGLIDEVYLNKPSIKIEALVEKLQEIINGDHKVLVFSQFTSFLSIIEKRLKKEKIDYTYLDGSTKDRKSVVAEFKTDKTKKVFLMSLKAGGVGLNLTEADYCIILDPWWNPAVENQAIARIHRIGQKKSVSVYKFIIKNSIEEKVLKLQEKKKKLFDSVLEEGAVFDNLVTEEDIKKLFDEM